MKDHLNRIEAHLKELEALTKSFGSNDDVPELLRIIHRPGWTTPAETQLVIALTEATITSIKQATHLRQELVKCAKSVGASTPVGVN
jgi:hypothetical protein